VRKQALILLENAWNNAQKAIEHQSNIAFNAILPAKHALTPILKAAKLVLMAMYS